MVPIMTRCKHSTCLTLFNFANAANNFVNTVNAMNTANAPTMYGVEEYDCDPSGFVALLEALKSSAVSKLNISDY